MAAAQVGIIRDGDNAILDINGDFKAFVTVSSKGCAWTGVLLALLTPTDHELLLELPMNYQQGYCA
jgi:hypothetical protein